MQHAFRRQLENETACDAAWFGPGAEDWQRGLNVLKRRGRLRLTVERIPGEGLLVKEIPGYGAVMIGETAWQAFAAGETKCLQASTRDLQISFSREDLAEFLPVSGDVVQVQFGRKS